MNSIKERLALASSVLLGLGTQAAADETTPWIIDIGAMNYIEQDRNTGVELIVNGSRELSDGGSLTLTGELDVITGATPNGATASNVPQTFTMASGVGSYQVGAGELPADDTHMDTRLGLKAALTDPVNDTVKIDYSTHISMEFDYMSLGLGGLLTADFDRRNTSLIMGINYQDDIVHAVGNTPVAFAEMNPPGQPAARRESSEYRRAKELTVGLNQVISRQSLAQIRLTRSKFSGYLNDPYKILSVVDDENISSLGATHSYVYENRPNQRYLDSLFLAYKRSFSHGILYLSYRWTDDTWDIHSQTLESAFKFKLDDRYFIRPSLRLYRQDAAFFYRHSLTSSEDIPRYASSDSRLAEFDATTIGVEYGRNLAFDRKQSITIEYYTQEGDSHPDDAVGLQQQQDLYPTLRTLIIKYVYSVKW